MGLEEKNEIAAIGEHDGHRVDAEFTCERYRFGDRYIVRVRHAVETGSKVPGEKEEADAFSNRRGALRRSGAIPFGAEGLRAKCLAAAGA